MNIFADQKEPSTYLNIFCYLEIQAEFPALQTEHAEMLP